MACGCVLRREAEAKTLTQFHQLTTKQRMEKETKSIKAKQKEIIDTMELKGKENILKIRKQFPFRCGIERFIEI